MQQQHHALLRLHETLLLFATLPNPHRLGLAMAVHQCLTSQRFTEAAQLVVATGACCPASCRPALLCDPSLLQSLLLLLDDAAAAGDADAAAAVVRAAHSLAKQPSAHSGPAAAVWGCPRQRHRLLRAACSSAAAADAVAAMAVTAACGGLPAALLLLDALESNCSSSKHAWAAVGLLPLLRRLRQVPSLLSGPEPSAAQPWLLLCAAMASTDGQLLSEDTCGELLGLFRQPSTIAALHTALLLLLLPPGCGDGGGGGGGAAAAAGAADADMIGELQAYSVQLLQHVAAHSAALAEQCFSMLAPVMTRLLLLQLRPAAADPAAPGVRAPGEPLVVPLWGKLLMKGCRGFSQALRSELQQRLPSVVTDLVAAGAACRLRAEEQDVHTWRAADASAVVVVQLAWAVQRGSDQPLVHLQQQHGGVPALAPADADALMQLLQAAAAAAAPAAPAADGDPEQGSAAAAAAPAGGVRPSGHMLLLTIWLLHVWAEQQQQQEQQQQVASMARALAALLAHDNDALALACNTAAAHLARLLLPRLGREHHDLLLAALALAFEKSGAAPERVATWQMLTAGCRLLGELAAAQRQQDAAAAAEAVPVRLFSALAVSSEASTSSGPGAACSNSATWRRLLGALRSLQERLKSHKLERSASKEELWRTLEGVLEQLSQLGVTGEK